MAPRIFHRLTGTSLALPLLLASLSMSTAGRTVNSAAPSTVAGCPTPLPQPTKAPALPPADFIVSVNGNLQWLVNGTVNPTLTLTRGTTYLLDLTAFGDEHPFVINANANNPFGTVYAGPSSGTTIPFTPTAQMPSTIYYHCEVHYGSMKGTIVLLGEMALCPGDLNSDLAVNSTDFGLFVGAFGTSCTECKADMNGDGVVNGTDFGLFVGAFGASCT
jgi:hypothetical protein